MDWSGAGGGMIAVRAIHFAATAVMAGTLVFRTMVARPALHAQPAAGNRLQAQTLCVARIALATALLSGAIWLLLQAVSMSGLPLSEAMTPHVLSTVLNQTQFGQVTEVRLVLAVVLAASLALQRFPPAEWLALAAAVGCTAAIAWTGHAASTPAEWGNLHLAADALHLVAAGAWIGGLVPLVLLLAAARRREAAVPASLALDATLRFSTLGIVGVATLSATGFVNAWILVGSWHALAATEYGGLLTLKLVVFTVMLMFAAVNRFALTPRLAGSMGDAPRLEAQRLMARNSAIEIVLGLVVFAVVGVLGTLHPAIHLVNH